MPLPHLSLCFCSFGRDWLFHYLPMFLAIPVLGQFSDISTVTRVHVDVGEPIHLTCHAPKSVPPPRFEWGLVREGSDPTSPTILTQDKRIQTDAEGNAIC